MGFNKAEEKAWNEYIQVSEKWEYLTRQISLYNKYRKDIEFSLPILARWYESLQEEYQHLSKESKKIKDELSKVNEEILSLR